MKKNTVTVVHLWLWCDRPRREKELTWQKIQKAYPATSLLFLKFWLSHAYYCSQATLASANCFQFFFLEVLFSGINIKVNLGGKDIFMLLSLPIFSCKKLVYLSIFFVFSGVKFFFSFLKYRFSDHNHG